MKKKFIYEKKILKDLAELNYYSILEKIEKVNDHKELEILTAEIEADNCKLMNNVCLSNG